MARSRIEDDPELQQLIQEVRRVSGEAEVTAATLRAQATVAAVKDDADVDEWRVHFYDVLKVELQAVLAKKSLGDAE